MSKDKEELAKMTPEEFQEYRRSEARRIALESLREDHLALERDAKYAFRTSYFFNR